MGSFLLELGHIFLSWFYIPAATTLARSLQQGGDQNGGGYKLAN